MTRREPVGGLGPLGLVTGRRGNTANDCERIQRPAAKARFGSHRDRGLLSRPGPWPGTENAARWGLLEGGISEAQRAGTLVKGEE
jgi:hypothetical protein